MLCRCAIGFLSLSANTFGGFGTEAEAAMRHAVKQAKLFRGESALSPDQLRQRLQFAVMRGVARPSHGLSSLWGQWSKEEVNIGAGFGHSFSKHCCRLLPGRGHTSGF